MKKCCIQTLRIDFVKCSKHFKFVITWKKACVQRNIHFKSLQLICDRISTDKMYMQLIRSSMPVHLKSIKKSSLLVKLPMTNYCVVHLERGLAHCGLGARFIMLLVFENKVLLEYRNACLFTYCLWLLLLYKGELSNCNIEWPEKPKIFSVWLLIEKVCKMLILHNHVAL